MASEEPDVDVLAKGKDQEQLGSEVSRKLEIAEDDNNGCKDLESKLITLISQPQHYNNFQFRRIIPLVIQIISIVVSVDFDSLPKPQSKLISLVTQTVLLFNSIDLDLVPEPLSELISLISQEISLDNNSDLEWDIDFLVGETWKVKPHPELISLIRQIVYVAISTNSKSKKLISLCPKVRVSSVEGKFHVGKKVLGDSSFDWCCFLGGWEKMRLLGEEDITYFHCKTCNGESHKEYEKAPVEIKHPLHPKHSLHLVWNSERVWNWERKARECYCCDEDLKEIFYYCSACDYAMNIGCVEKTLVLARDHPKWHEHTLALFPSQSSLPCNVCALTHTTCPFYICPPCDFVIHQRCINLPRLIRISRHPHRISFTPYFDQGDWFCGVCRRKINNDCGGYSCIKDNCLYAVHSQCATQTNVWDGIDLDGEPEEIEEEVEPFVSVGDGIIRHFSHEHHYLRLDENTCRDYDDNKLCQVCITPIYFGKLYYCLQCEYVLLGNKHEFPPSEIRTREEITTHKFVNGVRPKLPTSPDPLPIVLLPREILQHSTHTTQPDYMKNTLDFSPLDTSQVFPFLSLLVLDDLFLDDLFSSQHPYI